MLRLFINNNPTELFFSKGATLENLKEWFDILTLSEQGDLFLLNEAHSCWSSVTKSIFGDDILCISGDEDLKECTLEEVRVIM